MDKYITGPLIKKLREQAGMTQAELGEKLSVSDKTVSKWETAKGYPDISLLQPLAEALGISPAELMAGTAVRNVNISANMLRSKFYVCPVCGNLIHSMGEAAIHCHGIQLSPQQAELPDDAHEAVIQKVEDEYYVRIVHDMTKTHYISFMAAISAERLQMVKLYPEGNAEARFKIAGVKKLLFYCNRHGLFSLTVKNGVCGR